MPDNPILDQTINDKGCILADMTDLLASIIAVRTISAVSNLALSDWIEETARPNGATTRRLPDSDLAVLDRMKASATTLEPAIKRISPDAGSSSSLRPAFRHRTRSAMPPSCTFDP